MREWQAHVLGTVGAVRFLGGGLGFALRPAGRLRWAVVATAGDLEGGGAGRAETVLSFYLDPERRRGATAYAAGGVAVNLARRRTQGYLEFLLGLEARPAGRSGWFVEAGVGGGVRLAAGLRIRQRPPARK